MTNFSAIHNFVSGWNAKADFQDSLNRLIPVSARYTYMSRIYSTDEKIRCLNLCFLTLINFIDRTLFNINVYALFTINLDRFNYAIPRFFFMIEVLPDAAELGNKYELNTVYFKIN